ncbi:PREDICTED: uncharacterized protein LOC109215486 [Nicotiana attenuata]|uniref:uncharacterized protein LOC109215486 n=1 Tax=Nicotiana attenuata TaxID=49451 RepID=UPI000905299D|nr:PREDICTED: uncharacterized protein LOC109215486 [Nicotiana attenuata]
MRSDPSQRDPILWCEYHGTNGHRIGDYRYLQEEAATLLKNGHLREFLSDRAKNNYGRNIDNIEPSKTKVSITHSKRLREDDITFTEENADGLLLPHNDALVVSLHVLDIKIAHVLVDPGSSDNIILTGSIVPATKLLAGFNLASVATRGEILLLTKLKG